MAVIGRWALFLVLAAALLWLGLFLVERNGSQASFVVSGEVEAALVGRKGEHETSSGKRLLVQEQTRESTSTGRIVHLLIVGADTGIPLEGVSARGAGPGRQALRNGKILGVSSRAGTLAVAQTMFPIDLFKKGFVTMRLREPPVSRVSMSRGSELRIRAVLYSGKPVSGLAIAISRMSLDASAKAQGCFPNGSIAAIHVAVTDDDGVAKYSDLGQADYCYRILSNNYLARIDTSRPTRIHAPGRQIELELVEPYGVALSFSGVDHWYPCHRGPVSSVSEVQGASIRRAFKKELATRFPQADFIEVQFPAISADGRDPIEDATLVVLTQTGWQEKAIKLRPLSQVRLEHVELTGGENARVGTVVVKKGRGGEWTKVLGLRLRPRSVSRLVDLIHVPFVWQKKSVIEADVEYIFTSKQPYLKTWVHQLPHVRVKAGESAVVEVPRPESLRFFRLEVIVEGEPVRDCHVRYFTDKGHLLGVKNVHDLKREILCASRTATGWIEVFVGGYKPKRIRLDPVRWGEGGRTLSRGRVLSVQLD